MPPNPSRRPASPSGVAPRWADAAALVAGFTLPLGFAPFELFPLAVLAPAGLFVLWAGSSPGRAAWRGWLFGLGQFGVGVSWVYVSMHTYGHMPGPIAAFATFLLCAGLALYPALLGFVQARLPGAGGVAHGLLLLPGLWTLTEWWRGWFLTGFPWLNLGYSQADTWLAGYAPWLGVYGVSLFVALSAAAIAEAVRGPATLWWKLCLPVLAAVWLGGWAAGRIDWVEPAGTPLRVALVQGNVPLRLKWQPEQRPQIIDRYLRLSGQTLDRDLIVWPEAAVPAYWHQIGSTRAALEQVARERGVDFVFGVIEADAGRRAYYNSVAAIGRTPGLYRKQHLVPFGEYVPAPALFRWLVDSMHIPMSDFGRGSPDQPLLEAAGHKLGVSVCYEDAFGEEVIRALPQATVLVNVSEDAWFGNSLAPHQRLQMARLRALETARPMLRAANTGPSAVIDHRGEVLARSAQFQSVVLRAEVRPAMQGATPYSRLGNLPITLLAAVLIATGGLRRRARS